MRQECARLYCRFRALTGAVHAKDILDGGECKEKAVIIGGGSVGCETAEYLAEQGKKVTVIEMLDTMAEKMTNVARDHPDGTFERTRCGTSDFL